MDYARSHIKRFWGMVYRRTLGVSLVTLCVAISIGLTFVSLTSQFATATLLNYLLFWLFLVAVASFVMISHFYGAHVTSVKFMDEKEHTSHSKNMGVWMISIVVGAIIFLLPLLFVPPYLEPIALLLSFGGVFLILFASIAILFKHKYGELAIGGAAFLLLSLFGFLQLGGSQYSIAVKNYFAVYFAAMVITVVTGFVGLALIFNSTKESLLEFGAAIGVSKAGTRRRARR